MTNLPASARDMILGALVADAAAMGAHWIYDQAHIVKIAPDDPTFLAPDPKNYEGVKGYFAHSKRQAGDQSQYGEQVLVMLKALLNNDWVYDQKRYAEAFRSHFGFGGTYVGYIDKATRGALNNMEAAEEISGLEIYGIDDQQFPAIAKLPALIAAYVLKSEAQPDSLIDAVTNAIRLNSLHTNAISWGRVCAGMMAAAAGGSTIADAVDSGLELADPQITGVINEARSMAATSVNDVTAHFGLPCNLNQGVPSVVHNALTADSFEHAICANIYAGGDNCGRGILLGALLGAVHGVGGPKGIPQKWISKLTNPPQF